MPFLSEIDIKTFRGIDSLSVKKLARVNIFVGKNGVGKTSLLEAIGVAANPEHPGLLETFGRWRDFPPGTSETDISFRSVFPNMAIEGSRCELAFKFDSRAHRLQIVPKLQGQSSVIETSITTKSSIDTMDSDADAITGIVYNLSREDGYACECDLTLKADGYEVKKTVHARTKREAAFSGSFHIHARRANSATDTARVLTQLFERKEEAHFINTLNKIDSRVSRLMPGVKHKQPVIYVDIGLKRLIPISLLGDGFCRICLMLTGLANRKTKSIIIDEVDSGIHTSAMETFWKSLIAMTKATDVQVFCTTHSEEMLSKAADAFQNDPELLAIHRIDRTSNGTLNVKRYDYSLFQASTEANIDVR